MKFFINHREHTAGVIAILVAATFFLCVVTFFRFDIQRVHNNLGNKVMSGLDSLNNDINKTFTALNNFKFEQCDQFTLTFMHQILFSSTYMKEVGVYQDDALICTSTLGALEEPYISNIEPDIIGSNDIKIWLDEPILLFQGSTSASIVKQGNYGAVFLPFDISPLIPSNIAWQFVFKKGENKPPKILYQSTINAPLFNPNTEITADYSEYCVPKGHLCVSFLTTWKELFAMYKFVFILAIPLTLLIYLFIRIFINKKLARYNTLKYRVIKGLENSSFYTLYQPIIDLKTREIIGCEALARFEDHIGPIYPDQFIPIVRTLDKTWSFTENLLTKAMAEFHTNLNFRKGFRISFNIFPSDISSNKTLNITRIPHLLGNHFTIVFEVTEDEILDGKAAHQQLAWLKSQGISIAVDDFGTGYSNLNHIKNLNCQYLKIDRSFVNEMEGGSIKSSLIPHIVKIAQDLNLKIIAEGVENPQQADALFEAGVEFAQGWAFGKAMPLKELAALKL